MPEKRNAHIVICSACGQKINRCEGCKGRALIRLSKTVVCYMDGKGEPHHFCSDLCLWPWLSKNDPVFGKRWGFSLAKAVPRGNPKDAKGAP